MSKSIHTMKQVGPEDLKKGDFITLTHATVQWLPTGCDTFARQVKPMQAEVMTPFGGSPLQVVSMCLPFVLVKDTDGDHFPIDLRRFRIALLSKTYSRKTFKTMAPKESSKDKKKSRMRGKRK